MTDLGASAALRSGRRGHDRVWLLTTFLFAAGFLAFTWWVRPLASVPSPFHLPWWSLAIAFAVSDIFVVHLHHRRDAMSFSLSEIPLVVGLFFAGPTALILGRMVGGAAALTLHRRQSGLKLAFNLGQYLLFEGVLPIIIFRSIVGIAGPDNLLGWAGAYLAVLSTNLGSGVVISAAGLLNGTMPFDTLGLRALAGGLIAALGNTSLALVCVVVLWHDAASSWLLLLMAGILYLVYRGYIGLSQTYARLEMLYRFTRAVNWSLNKVSALETVLAETRELMRADMAVATLIPAEPGAPLVHTSFGPGDAVETTQSEAPNALDNACVSVVRSGKGLLLPKPVRDEELRRAMEARGFKDAVLAPLRSEGGIVGTIMVANRLGDVGTFETEDLRVLETVTNHASVTLENRRLVDQLREEAADKEYQALHDSLTGLPNRVLFNQCVGKAISALENREGWVAVLLLDMDDFKEINDTLGHYHGDLLLKEIGNRLGEVLRPDDTVARLGGDEFAVLLPRLTDPNAVRKVARRICHAFERNFQLTDLTLEVRASIGIALYPDHGSEAETLLQRADVAMYMAKEHKQGFEVYALEKDQSNPRRLALMAELRLAIQNDQLDVYYQPQARIGDRAVVGVEALLRWQHPEHGFVPPDEFVPMAEHTGLIRPLTLYVLRKSMLQCLRWRQQGIDLRLAVNLSVRSLLDLAFPMDVNRLLKETGYDPADLTLEVTETSIMADPGRMLAELRRLDTLGVKLSIDDFGTGYSSLSYLSRLPVGEVKIDRSFVMHMMEDENDAVIVQSVIDLGRNLNLQVVAEGIEDGETWRRLAAMGCDIAQGYHLGRPMPAVQLDRWLLENGVFPAADSARAPAAHQTYAPAVTPLRPSARRRRA